MNDIKEKIKAKNKEISASLESKPLSVSKVIEYLHKELTNKE